MDFVSVETIDNGVILKDVRNFNVKHVFECGQAFRWHVEPNGNYICVAFGRVIELEERDEDIIIYNTNKEDFENIWLEYFDLNRDYGEIKCELSKDPILKESVEFGYGIRILKQDPFEMLISFIISANNRIPMIKRAIWNISNKWGKELTYKDKKYYTFPTVEDLKNVTLEELEKCGTGFRAKYIANTVERLANNEEDLQVIKELSADECHKALQRFSGVGPKVADCIMLFSMEKYSAFPVDVWVKRAMQFFYLAPDVSLPKIRVFAREKFGDLSGFAQQYLFYNARENNINIDGE
ncbi:N-glycosylase/DNA lyase [Clostridium collagenovorans DSM 3089]|uniref:DNA-(apurinic or apyrimidinic site) lyase n=1 Tax=Clostridium collagenovorans DSM 3089 TaxID=1121306 RepID=A0A1M5VXK2_9CLOT|nr:DNA-3-methyladenine glycosylase [Clostridium collagenovorans]SHH79931.1 N-glycosylase/DNA lyase [Clostridium collagenovorans DSM 3089]